MHNSNIKIVNIQSFLTYTAFNTEVYYNYDLREPTRKITNPDKLKETKKTVITTSDWSNIPHYPTAKEKREDMAKQIMKQGRSVPSQLLKQIEQDKIEEINKDLYNRPNNPINKIPFKTPPNKFSPQYAGYVGAKPRAQASARVGLGGVF